MAEVMTVETILEADWLLQGFWAKPRFALKMASRGWSDIDVLAYHPESRHLVIAESKVRGPKKHVFAYTAHTQARYRNILKWDEDNNHNYFGFLDHVPRICKDGAVFRDFRKMVKRLTVQLVSNYVVSEDVKFSALQAIEARIRSKVPQKIALDVRMETTLDVICRIIATENRSKQGRRYGHAVIDIARELNRYMHPQIRHAGRDAQAGNEIRDTLTKKLLAALRGECGG